MSCSLLVTCWERAAFLSLLYVMFSCVFVTFPYGILGQVRYLIVLIPDLRLLPYIYSVSINCSCWVTFESWHRHPYPSVLPSVRSRSEDVYLKATPFKVLVCSFLNFADVLFMVRRCACGFDIINIFSHSFQIVNLVILRHLRSELINSRIILGQVWCLIVSIPDLCLFLTFIP